MNGFGLIQILLLLPCWLIAQWRQPRLVHFGSEQGMGYFSMDICQDVQGYIYFATDQGMVRYDGSEFKLFAHNPNDSSSIGPGDVWNISLGRDSLLWMGTRQSGIISFDPRTLRFTKHINPFKKGNIDRVSTVLADSACIWSGSTDSELFNLDTKTNKFELFHPVWTGDTTIKKFGFVRDLLQDKYNPELIWFSVDNNPLIKKQGLVSFNKTNHSFQFYACQGRPKYQDDEGNIWLVTNGISQFNPKVNESRHFPTLYPAPDFRGMNTRDIIPFKNQYMVAAPFTLLWFKPNGEYDYFFHNRNYGIIEDIFEDRNNNIWFGRLNGVSVLPGKEEIFRVYPLTRYNIRDRIYPGRLGYNIKSKTVYVVDHSTDSDGKRIINIQLDTDSSSIFYFHKLPIYGVTVDTMGVLWMAAEDGLFKFENNLPRRQLPFDGLDPFPSLWNMQTSASGFIVCLAGHEIIWWKDPTDFKQIKLNSLKKGEQKYYPFYGSSIAGPDKLILFSNRIFELDLQSGSITELYINYPGGYKYDLDITGAVRTRNGEYWITTLAFTAQMRRKKDSLYLIKNYSVSDGLQSAWQHELYADHAGRVWAFAQNGINVIKPDANEIHFLGEYEGLANAYMDPRQILTLPDNSIITVSGNGIIQFHPDSVWNSYAHQAIPIVIQEIRVEGKLYAVDRDYNDIDQIKLSPDQQYLDIHFQGLSYPTDYNIKYSYRIDGLLNRWRSIGHNKIINISNIASGKYTLRIKEGDIHSTGQEKKLTIIVSTPFYKQAWFLFLSITLLSLLLLALNSWRIKARYRKENEELRVKKQFAELELKALHAQMNPHFMFNSLNSIKSYILKAEPKLAAEYLSNFAHLIRMILQNSKEKTISLSQEIETLLLYIELEKMRFDNKFEFGYSIDSSLDINKIQVPPLILQPYVENAIWHGLMHRREVGKLVISLEQRQQQIHCIIQDNGIGRAAAGKIKKDTDKKYKSLGMRITQDRIDLMNELDFIGISTETVDLFSVDGTPVGTKVIIKIPFFNRLND